MADMRFTFVVLHYQNAEVTRECLGNLEKLRYVPACSIVVVDNASPNGSGKMLKEEYVDHKNIHFILLDSNVGFAAGNNAGYRYAKEILEAEAILVINSDLYVQDVLFLEKLQSVIERNREDGIIAVDIVTRFGGHQNPFRMKAASSKKIRKIIFRKRIGQILYAIPGLNRAIIRRKPQTSTDGNRDKVEQEMRGIVPHGACVIYTDVWIRKEDMAFLEGTFLFMEEEILYDYCCHRHYVIHYVPWLSVFHMEDASQNADAASALVKKRRQLKYEISSRKLLLKLRKQYNKQ